ncbi:hypothetical protein GCM10010353_42640 [Streptomyces chryseus]|nr:hypothetical protein GCM10010353_42640 [Streptomyces chryseus]
MSRETDEVDEALTGELRLMDPSVRMSQSLARQLLDPDFVEVGACGRRWTYEEMLAELPVMDGAADDGSRYEPSGMFGVVLAPGLVHLTYETTCGGASLSGWQRQDATTTKGHRDCMHVTWCGPAAMGGQNRPHRQEREADRDDCPVDEGPPLLGAGSRATTNATAPPPPNATRPASAAGRSPQAVSRWQTPRPGKAPVITQNPAAPYAPRTLIVCVVGS